MRDSENKKERGEREREEEEEESVLASDSRLALDKLGYVLHVAPSVSPSATSESINKTGVGEAKGRPGGS